jgi:hypothetical protein
MGRIAPAEYRARATALLHDSPAISAPTAGSATGPATAPWATFYLTSYVLHVHEVAETMGVSRRTTA